VASCGDLDSVRLRVQIGLGLKNYFVQAETSQFDPDSVHVGLDGGSGPGMEVFVHSISSLE